MKRLFAMLFALLVGLVGLPLIAHANEAVADASTARPAGVSGLLATQLGIGLTVGTVLWITVGLIALAAAVVGLRRTRVMIRMQGAPAASERP